MALSKSWQSTVDTQRVSGEVLLGQRMEVMLLLVQGNRHVYAVL